MRVQLRFALIFLVGLWGDNGVALGASTEEIVAMEIRSALNYQTGVVKASIDQLTQVKPKKIHDNWQQHLYSNSTRNI